MMITTRTEQKTMLKYRANRPSGTNFVGGKIAVCPGHR